MNKLLQTLAASPQAYPLAMCLVAGMCTALAALLHTLRARRAYKHICGPVPKIHETKAIKAFNDRFVKLTEGAENCIALAVLGGVVDIFMFFYLMRVTDGDIEKLVILLATPLVYALFQFMIVGSHWSTKSEIALTFRPELSILKYVPELPDEPNGQPNSRQKSERIFRGSLDDYACSFEINAADAQYRSTAPVELADAQNLSDAQWTASNDERPAIGDRVLIIWRDSGKKDRVKALVSNVTAVENISAQLALARPGKSIVTVLNEQFCGGKVAHFCGTPNNKIDRGWIATADRAHVLLASLSWLDKDQRELCYQLINPGKPFPLAANGV